MKIFKGIYKLNFFSRQIFVIALIINCLNALGQNNCTNYIKNDSTNKTVSTGTVLFFSATKQTIYFTYLNNDGSFELPELDSTKIVATIIIKSFGYQSLTLKIEQNILPCNKVFYLFPNNVNEIKVVANNSFTIKPDTTKFNANAYKIGSEENIENLLTKLPFVSIDANGYISFKGKTINMLTVEGDDLFGNYYQGFTKNVNTNGIQSFEFIENYIDSVDRANGVNTKKTLLNIIYKKTKRLFASINTSISPDIKNGELKGDIINLGLKAKSVSFVNTNNIGFSGSNSINNADYLYALNGTNFLQQYPIDPNNQFELISNYKIPQEKLQLNNSVIGSFNLFKKLKTNAVFRQNLQIQLDNFSQQYKEFTKYELGNSLLNFNMITNRKLKNGSILNNTKVEKYLNYKWKLIKNLKVVALVANNSNNTILQSIPLVQSINKNTYEFKYTQQFINIKDNPKNLGHYFEAFYGNNSGIYSVDSINYFSSLFNSYINSSQQAIEKTVRLNYEFHYKSKFFNKIWNSFINANYFNNKFKLNFGDKLGNVIANNNISKSNNVKTIFITSNNSTSFSINRFTTISLGLKALIGYNFLGQQKTLFNLLPSINLQGILWSKLKYTFSFDKNANLPTLFQIRPINFIDAINNIHRGNANYEMTITNKLALNIIWNKLYNERKYQFSTISINYNLNKNPYLSKFITVNQLIYILDSSLINLNNNFYGGFNKNILIKRNSFIVNFGLFSAKNNFINANGIASNFIVATKAELSWKYTLPKKMFFEISGAFSNNYNSNVFKITSLNKVFSNISLKQNIEKKFSDKIIAQFANELYYFKGSNNISQSLNFMDAKITYIINKKGANIALQGRNIFNINTFIEQNNSGISSQTNTFYLFPRLIIFKANIPI